MGRHLVLGRFQRLGERTPELVEHLVVVRLLRLDLIQFLLQMAGELEVHDLREVLDEQVGHVLADLGGVEAAVLDLDVAALRRGDLVDDGGVGARPADALLLQRLDQRRLVVARRRLREVLAGRQVQPIELLLLAQGRQRGVLLLAGRRQHLAIAVELEHLALRLEQTARPLGVVGRRGQHFHVGDGEHGRGHLAGHEPLIDQRVQPQLIAVQAEPGDAIRRVGQVGRPDRLVRFLSTLSRGVGVRAGRHIVRAVLAVDVRRARLAGRRRRRACCRYACR